MADQGSEGLLSPFLRSQRIKAAMPFIKGRVLDVGCGSGELAGLVPESRYLGVEIDEISIAKARKQYPKHCFESSLPKEPQKFDTVVCLAVLEHVSDPKVFLLELSKQLRPFPVNCIVCTTPHPDVKWVHNTGALIGFFSRHASEEHEKLLNKKDLETLSQFCNLHFSIYRRFLFGGNQLAIFRPRCS